MGKFTVFGGRGFIGSEFVNELNRQGHEVYVPERGDENIYTSNLGIVIYSAGYGDCQKDPFNVFTANVALLSSLLQKAKFNKLVYISSTRVYMNQNVSDEDCDLKICHDDGRRLFNLTKLTAEELCLRSRRDCLIVRPSNVYGLALNSTLFLPSIIRDAIKNGIVNMYIDKSYAKDYISVFDVVHTVIRLLDYRELPEIVNIGSGENISAKEIADMLVRKTGCKINWETKYDIKEVFPLINLMKIKEIMDYEPKKVLDDLSTMIDLYKENMNDEK
ncbi:TPA: NAD-dependent epimerase/dehydratase family protein [Photobacterium damselae]